MAGRKTTFVFQPMTAYFFGRYLKKIMGSINLFTHCQGIEYFISLSFVKVPILAL